MKRIVLAAVLLALVAVLFMPHIYIQTEFPGPAQVLWNDKSAFVFLEKNQQGWNRTPIQLAVDVARSMAGGYSRFTGSRSDVAVFEISEGEIRSHFMPHFDVLSGVFPYRGALYVMYYENGKPELPKNYRWTGEAFVPISIEEAQRIRSEFQFVSDITKREGWKSQQIYQNSDRSGC